MPIFGDRVSCDLASYVMHATKILSVRPLAPGTFQYADAAAASRVTLSAKMGVVFALQTSSGMVRRYEMRSVTLQWGMVVLQ